MADKYNQFIVPNKIPLIPGYYYSSKELTAANQTTESKEYIGTTVGENYADNPANHRYIYNLINESTAPELVSEFKFPKDGYIYLLSTAASILGSTNAGFAGRNIPAGTIAYFAENPDNPDEPIIVKVVETNGRAVFSQSVANNTVQRYVPSTINGESGNYYLDVRSYVGTSNLVFSEIIRNNGLWNNIKSNWPSPDNMASGSTDEAVVKLFNQLKSSTGYTRLWEFPKRCWDNVGVGETVVDGAEVNPEETTIYPPMYTNEDGQRIFSRYSAYRWRQGLETLPAGTIGGSRTLTGLRDDLLPTSCYLVLRANKTISKKNPSGFNSCSISNPKNDNSAWKSLEKLTFWWRYLLARYIDAGDSKIRSRCMDFGWSGMGWFDSYINSTSFVSFTALGEASNMSRPESSALGGMVQWNPKFMFYICTPNCFIHGYITLSVGGPKILENPSWAGDDDTYEAYFNGTTPPAVGADMSNNNNCYILPNVVINSLNAAAAYHTGKETYIITKPSASVTPNLSPKLFFAQVFNSDGQGVTPVAGAGYPDYNDMIKPNWWDALYGEGDWPQENDWSFDKYTDILDKIERHNYEEINSEIIETEDIDLED